MYKIGDNVSVEAEGGKVYGVVIGFEEGDGAISIAIGEERIVQSRGCFVSYDEGYKKLRQEKYS